MRGSVKDTDLLEGQDELVQPPPLRQAHFGHGHVVEQRQHGDFIRRHPVFDAEHVRVDHSVRHHGVEVQTLMHTRHRERLLEAGERKEPSLEPNWDRLTAGHERPANVPTSVRGVQ